ncbi:MAG: DegT/DnrJ/EryC1/StrS family aminotransferase [Bacillota bacterium]|nr:DegT/DnrJ/EryC1/StrS family aminotransferase [Bacillota bacterium]MDD3298041.1 DegT/DnrJ/EryC1/StrS family aminotransferase [Bacillota bacterium]MDD3850490.1 DegT/DnrJ/EryC1/StrS family aminotransferase [Bacillota bacterium]MDD4707720.1 DegT/DnrJ/EryC1/StrS family aminotransferase [Bacillota bacterium]
MIPITDLSTQYKSIGGEIQKEVSKVLESGSYIMGKHVRQFEEDFAAYNGCKYAIGVANGTDALVISLMAAGIGKGDEVITTSFSFFATAEAISSVGAKPVFADIDTETYNIDPGDIKGKITSKTKAIVPVHIFGNPANMEKILNVASKHKLYVIEDACQAVGALYNGKRAGSIGNAGCFSFFPSKNLGCCGDGGAIITNDERTAVIAKALSSHGGGETGLRAYNLITGTNEKGSPDKYCNYLIGCNSRLDEIQAAILNIKLKYLDRWNEQRREKAYLYNSILKDYSVSIPKEETGSQPSYHIYTLRTRNRDIILKELRRQEIDARVYYSIPLHLQKGLEHLGYKKGDMKSAEKVIPYMISLPLYPELTAKEQNRIIKCLINTLT